METQPSSPTLPSAPTADNKQQQNESLTAPPPSPAISDAAPDMQEMEESIEIDLGYVTPAEHEEELAVRFSTQEEIHQEQPEQEAESERDYLHLSGGEDALIKHLARQAIIVKDALLDRTEVPLSVEELSRAYELNLFSPRVPPKRQPNGTCEPNPRLNFYPVFAVPEALATYHIFFKNQRIPVSCRANRTRADALFDLGPGARIPDIASLEEVPKIFEGLGSDETRAANALQGEGGEHEHHSALVELEGDNARLAVLKRTIELTHFAYPALNLPPKVMSTVMDQVLIKRASPTRRCKTPRAPRRASPWSATSSWRGGWVPKLVPRAWKSGASS